MKLSLGPVTVVSFLNPVVRGKRIRDLLFNWDIQIGWLSVGVCWVRPWKAYIRRIAPLGSPHRYLWELKMVRVWGFTRYIK